jgi:hypothetical protein
MKLTKLEHWLVPVIGAVALAALIATAQAAPLGQGADLKNAASAGLAPDKVHWDRPHYGYRHYYRHYRPYYYGYRYDRPYYYGYRPWYGYYAEPRYYRWWW